MASVNSRHGKLYIDFRYLGIRCREQTTLSDTQTNRKRAKQFVKQLEKEINLGEFRYEKYSPIAKRLTKLRCYKRQRVVCNTKAWCFLKNLPSYDLLRKSLGGAKAIKNTLPIFSACI